MANTPLPSSDGDPNNKRQDLPADDPSLGHGAFPGERERAFMSSLEAGFVGRGDHAQTTYAPRLLINDAASSRNVLSSLEREFASCESFDISVAFVTTSGVVVLMRTLLDLERRGAHGRVLVSTYLGFNEPDALARLSSFPNLELRVHEGPLHSKGYLFSRQGMRTLVVGSSNLTQNALLENGEWNLLVTSYETGSIAREIGAEFDRLWHHPDTRIADGAWLAAYRKDFRRLPGREAPLAIELDDGRARTARVKPNKMQQEALQNLRRLHEAGAERALLISATGTGKTYLSAFDVAAVNPRRLLFVVHRERIARAALESFSRIVSPARSLGLFTGTTREAHRDYLFCTVQSLSRNLASFPSQAFDYVVFDEAHHVGAGSYQAIANHFRPRFLLGMTATPTRGDDFDVFAFFHHTIAYQITLQKAQESSMLAPFHYFGIHELEVDGETLDDLSDFAHLTSPARVNHVLEQLECYAVDTTRRGLVFCRSVEEAHSLAAQFSSRGHPSIALDGSSSDELREQAIERLECDRSTRDDWLEFIFTRDIFNEGVDIPSVNLIVMLRPTESAIVFVQQLGRGLRLHEGKDYVLVLDFIGNYQKSYLIPIALSGDHSYNKDDLRRFVQEGNRTIPGCSTINFDEVTEGRIYELIDATRFGSIALIKQEYRNLREMLGRIPSLRDFHENGAIDPQLIFSNQRLGSYHAFLSKYERDYHVRFDATQEQMLRFVSSKLASGKHVQDLILLRLLLDEGRVEESSFADAVHAVSPSLPVSACAVRSLLGGRFLTGGQANTFRDCVFLSDEEGRFSVSRSLARALQDPAFARQLREVVDFGILMHEERYGTNYDSTSLVLYRKYTYEDVCHLLGWRQNVSGQNIGGYKYDAETNTFPVFINYEKGDDIADTIRYLDRFVDRGRLIAISKQPRTLSSPDIERLRHQRETGMRAFLFVRKNKKDADSKEFYFLGEMTATGSFVPIIMEGTDKPAVEITYDLTTPVPDELFDYLTSATG